VIRFRIRRESVFTHIVHIVGKRIVNNASQIGILADKLRLMPESKTEQVRVDENLAVAMYTRADSDGGDIDSFSDQPRDLDRNTLKHNRKASRVLKCDGVVNQLLSRFDGLALNFVPPHLV